MLIALEHELKEISNVFSQDVRSLLGEYTSDIFKKLIDKKDLEIINHVEIDSYFQIGASSNIHCAVKSGIFSIRLSLFIPLNLLNGESINSG